MSLGVCKFDRKLASGSVWGLAIFSLMVGSRRSEAAAMGLALRARLGGLEGTGAAEKKYPPCFAAARVVFSAVTHAASLACAFASSSW